MQCACCGRPMTGLGEFKGFRHSKCDDCGYEHFLADSTVVSSGLYQDDADYIADMEISRDHRSLLQWNHYKAIDYIQRGCRQGATVLDVGCFNGFLVRELLNRGFDAKGVDFNEVAIEFGRMKYGLGDRISTQAVEDLVPPERGYDVITLFEVIEHLPSFDRLLGVLSGCLALGGVLIISTPNARMSWRPPLDFPPHHLSRFTPEALRALVRSHGLEDVASYEQASLFDCLRNYIGLFFRANRDSSLRGGEFRMRGFVNLARRGANLFKRSIYVALYPIDRLLGSMGFRYISQVVIARRGS